MIPETEREKELLKQVEALTLERNGLHYKLIDLRLDGIEIKQTDQESRMRTLETIATRSNVLFTLATGGGLISIITLFRTLSLFP